MIYMEFDPGQEVDWKKKKKTGLKWGMVLVNAPDLIEKHFDYSQLMSYGQHTARIRLDRICWTDSPHPVQFHSSKDHIVQDRPRSSCDCEGLVFAKCIWSGNKPACKNPWAWFLQNATNLLLVSCFQTWLPLNFTRCPDLIGQNQPGSISVLLKLDHSTILLHPLASVFHSS